MKKIFALLTLSIFAVISTTTLAASYIPFTTIAQAEEYCPPITGLTFTPLNQHTQNSKGFISGIKNAVFHNSGYPDQYVMQPKNLDGNTVQDVSFRQAGGIYGFISGNNITCLYSYPGFTGVNVALILNKLP